MKTTIKCSTCKKVTNHYISKTGEYRCMICGTVNKVGSPKKDREITFEPSESLDKLLNPED